MATLTQATEESIKLWLKVGNLKKLEQAVLDGYGNQLRGRNSRIPKINKFLKRVPHYQAKITAIHTAASQGNVRDLENLLDRKGLVYSRDSSGATALHIAVQNRQTNVVQYLLNDFPSLVHARDHCGRTALHYEAAIKANGDIYQMLVNAGADPQLKDMVGKSPLDYANNPQDIQLQPRQDIMSAIVSRRQSREVSSMLRQPSPIIPMTRTEMRSIIQKGDIAKLERVIQQGYGERLVGETTTSSRVKDILDSVPHHLNKLASLQTAIENGSLREVQNLLNRKNLVTARDSQGLTILHKATIHGQRDIVQYLIHVNPKSIFVKDHDKRTPVHYAAVLEDDGEIYNMLMESGGNVSLPDCDGKTPEYYRQNPTALDLKRALERRSEGSGKLSNTNSNEYQSKNVVKSGKRKLDKFIWSEINSSNGGSHNVIRQWLKSGDIDKLEKAVIDGHGLRIIRETTADPRARAFLKTLPVYMAKITAIHEAVCNGELRNIKVLLDRRKLVLARDKLGLGLLHKAVLFGQEDIVTFLVENYPETCAIKDKTGKTALHYAAARDDPKFYEILCEGGADPALEDMKGNSALHYQSKPEELDMVDVLKQINRQRRRQSIAGKQNITIKPQETAFNITSGNIRKWIHAEEIKKLEQVVLEGQGYKLLLETSNNPRVKQFLASVPSLVKRIKDIHNAVVLGDSHGVESSIEKPELLLGKDDLGMTPLHKAVLMEEAEIIQFIINNMPASLKVSDEEDRTALHYAAGLKDDGFIFEMLSKAGADKEIIDNKGKSADHYINHPGELDMRQLQVHIQRNKTNIQGKQEAPNNNNNNHISHNNVKRQIAGANLRPVRKASISMVNNETITRMIQQSDLEKLEQLVLDGHGKRLTGRSSWNEDIRAFLKKVPQYMDKIYAVHTAAATGDLLVLQQLLDTKKIVTSKDEYGLTALHKAIKYGQTDVVKYLLQTFPASHSTKDQDGRTPLHYASMYKDREDIYQILVNRGADAKAQDHRGRSPGRYLSNQNKLDPPVPPKRLERIQQDSAEDDSVEDGQLNTENEKQVDVWISKRDIEELENLLISGHGDRLLGKSSDDPKIQEFLEGIPADMGKIRAIHNAAANGELRDLHLMIDREILATSLDENKACPLHRAVLHGHKDVMKFLANNYPACLNIQDKSGLTPLHYAALSGNDGLLYRQLSNCGANPNVKDKSGITPGQMMRGKIHITLDELRKRYEEKRVPPRPLSVQTWERPPTEDLLRALTPSPMISSSQDSENSNKVEIEQNELEQSQENSNKVDAEQNEPQQIEETSKEAEIEFKEQEQREEDIIEIREDEPKEENNEVITETIRPKDMPPDELNSDALVDDLAEAHNIISDKNIDPDDPMIDKDDNRPASRQNSITAEDQNSNANEENPPTKSENEIQDNESVKSNADVEDYEKEIFESDEPNELKQENNETEQENHETKHENNETDGDEGLEQVVEETEQEIRDNQFDNDAEKQMGSIKDNQMNDEANDAEKEIKDDKIDAEADDAEMEIKDDKIDAEADDAEMEIKDDKIDAESDDAENETKGKTPDNEADDIVKTDNVDEGEDDDSEVVIYDGNRNETNNENEIIISDKIDLPETETNEQDVNNMTQETQDTHIEEVKNNKENNQENGEQETTTDFNENTGRESGVVIDSEETSLGSPDIRQENQTPEAINENKEFVKSTDKNDGDCIGSENVITSAANPMMWTKEGEYLTAVLGDALINALAEVSRMRPQDPLTYLSLLLYKYLQMGDVKNEKTNTEVTKNTTQNGIGTISKCRLLLDEDGIVDIKKLCEMKGLDGSTVVHYMVKIAHENDSFFELLRASGYNIAERDSSYRTIRDVAHEKAIQDNVDAIDRYIFSLVANGDNTKLKAMMLDGYNHMMDIFDEEGNDTIMVAELNHRLETVQLLKNYQLFQEKVELLHESVLNNNQTEAKSILAENNEYGRGKNTKGQTALHIAVLVENEDLVKSIAKECSLAINTTDNLGRTPLHYAMGTSKPEAFAKIIVQNGGNQLLRDSTKHTPSYYFINNQDIQKLKDEMEEITI